VSDAPGSLPRARIAGTGAALPDKRVTNADLESMVDTSDSWIVERTGIRERRILEPERATSDLASAAGLRACEMAGVAPADLDCIIVGTVTPDMPFPSCATSVQRKMGAPAGIPAFDLSAACAGFLYGLTVADGFVARGLYRRILVVGVEVLSRIIDWTDRNTCVLFGDGAGAVVVTAESVGQRGILSSHIHADGTYSDMLCIPAGGTREALTPAALEARRHLVKMNGREVYRHAVKNIAAACKQALEANGLGPDDVNVVVAHQANIRIIEAVAERVGIPMDRFHLNLERYGNTSSASVPIALDEAVRAGRVHSGDIILMCAFGGGFAWGSTVMRW
jgi:3-oxoacyl-[acyl-carrier-protein] synthase III